MIFICVHTAWPLLHSILLPSQHLASQEKAGDEAKLSEAAGGGDDVTAARSDSVKSSPVSLESRFMSVTLQKIFTIWLSVSNVLHWLIN